MSLHPDGGGIHHKGLVEIRLFQRQQGGHDFGGARHGEAAVGILCKVDPPAPGINHHRTLGSDGKLFGIRYGLGDSG